MTAEEVYVKHSLSPVVEKFWNERNHEKYHAGDYHNQLARHVVEAAALQPGMRVLDLACGTGIVSSAAAHAVGPSGHIVGVDISDGMLSFARNYAEAEGLSCTVDFRKGDVEDLQKVLQDEEAFDAVLCVSSIPYFSDGPKALKHWREFLRSGGFVVISGITGDSVIAGVLMQQAAKRFGIDLPVWSKDTASVAACRCFMETAGFRDVDIHEREYGSFKKKEEVKMAYGEDLRTSGLGNHPLMRQLQSLGHSQLAALYSLYKEEVDCLPHDGNGSIWDPNTNLIAKGFNLP